MKFKVDENLPIEMTNILMDFGYEASTTYDEDMKGFPDHLIADRCRKEGKALVTLDTGFADIRAYPPDQFAGLIY
jgi:predicted nuclease of predicted toxin-antitoxin system